MTILSLVSGVFSWVEVSACNSQNTRGGGGSDDVLYIRGTCAKLNASGAVEISGSCGMMLGTAPKCAAGNGERGRGGE